MGRPSSEVDHGRRLGCGAERDQMRKQTEDAVDSQDIQTFDLDSLY